jgi:integrase
VALNPLRAIVQAHLDEGTLAVNPTVGVKLPRGDRGRQRIADPAEAQALLDALPAQDRALWATALYGGLRRGELRALRWSDVDLAQGIIRVERGWDDREGEQQTKGRNGVVSRSPGSCATTSPSMGWRAAAARGSCSVAARRSPFKPSAVTARADRAWRDAGVERITMHECRHTFASLMIEAGVNAKAISTYMGHANIGITLDRYGHLMPGNEEQAADLLDGYLQRGAEQAARAAEPTAAATE